MIWQIYTTTFVQHPRNVQGYRNALANTNKIETKNGIA